jgi:hypothetical protein
MVSFLVFFQPNMNIQSNSDRYLATAFCRRCDQREPRPSDASHHLTQRLDLRGREGLIVASETSLPKTRLVPKRQLGYRVTIFDYERHQPVRDTE